MRQELRQAACAVAGWAEHLWAMHAGRLGPFRVRQRADPAFTPAQPVWVVAEYVLDRGSDSRDGVSGARPRGGKQNQAGMHPALRQPLRRKRTEVLDVVRYYRSAFARCDLEDDPIAAPGKVLAAGNGVHVIAGLAQQDRDLRRQLLVQDGSHE